MSKIHKSLCKLFSEYYGLFFAAGVLTCLFSVWPIGIGISSMTVPEWTFLTWKTGCLLYGFVNLVTAFIALCAISPCEFELSVDWEDRFDKLLKPLIIFFPLLLILWGFILVICICFWIFMGIYKMYKCVEAVIFGE
jgi:hypothetical protein